MNKNYNFYLYYIIYNLFFKNIYLDIFKKKIVNNIKSNKNHLELTSNKNNFLINKKHFIIDFKIFKKNKINCNFFFTFYNYNLNFLNYPIKFITTTIIIFFKKIKYFFNWKKNNLYFNNFLIKNSQIQCKFKFISILPIFFYFFLNFCKSNTKLFFNIIYTLKNSFVFDKRILSLKNFFYFCKFFINIKDFFFLINKSKSFYNKNLILLNTFNLNNYNNYLLYTNYYPISLFKTKSSCIFKNKFNDSYDKKYSLFLNKIIISFLEKLLKKFFFIKIVNNSFYEKYNWYLFSILEEYKYYKPAYFKTFLISDFIKIIWYSFFIKDISLLSKWITVFMENMSFKNHKKFLLFFNNFIKKYSTVFIDILKIKGFFFDIRGKVGVTGSSKKRHIFIKFGILNKFNKKNKIDFDQKLVRTYSGVMGLTYLINY